MGEKKELRRRIALLERDCRECEAENAHAINRNIQLGEENDRLNDTIADLETVIVGLNRAVFGIGATKSVELYNSADWPS